MSLKNLKSSGIFFRALTENSTLEHWFSTFRTLDTGQPCTGHVPAVGADGKVIVVQGYQ